MDYPLSPANVFCRTFGHRWRSYTDHDGIARRTCKIDGKTEPPFRKVRQTPEGGYLPDDEQPEGAR